VFAFDRWLTLYGVAPFRRLFARRAERVLPILMYHSISDDPETGVSSYYRICTSLARFGEQMSWLAAHGWRGVTLRDGLAWLEGQKPMTGKPVALTFDDGFRDFHTDAAPMLRKHGFRATMYLITDYVSETATPKAFKGRPCLTWDEVRTLFADGFEFGSHTVSHPELVRVGPRELQRQLAESRDAIARRLGVPVPGFAYPYAFPVAGRAFVARLQEVLRNTGYSHCVTTRIGRLRAGFDSVLMPRLPVNQDDDRAMLAAKLTGAYDWLAFGQGLAKQARRVVGRRTTL
jgi:peptidoglycan/xylan/chitin deacetylase (PgdA/CDA1 family)